MHGGEMDNYKSKEIQSYRRSFFFGVDNKVYFRCICKGNFCCISNGNFRWSSFRLKNKLDFDGAFVLNHILYFYVNILLHFFFKTLKYGVILIHQIT